MIILRGVVYALAVLFLPRSFLSMANAIDADVDTEDVEAGDSDSSSGKYEPEADERRVIASINVRNHPLAQEDQDDRCATWASEGECETNPKYMLQNCAISCNHQDFEMVQASVYEGEDAAIATMRFAEDYGIGDVEKLLAIAQQLQESYGDYIPPADLTHCSSGNKKPKLCSAGKLWKRAEELRKADMHDAAGADLMRALLKSGIEVDFVQRCRQSLQWALGSLQRQRLREQKEAEEAAQLEQQRLEEEAAMAESQQRRNEYEAAFVEFGKRVADGGRSESESEATIDANGDIQHETSPNKDIIVELKTSFGVHNNCADALRLAKKLPLGDKSVDTLLIEARCYELDGQYKNAMSAAGKVIQKAAAYNSLPNDSPIILAMQLGANAAIQLGLSDNALSFYQTVLRFDPEQDRARKQYRGLKKVLKILDKVETEIQKGYNKAASVLVDDCLSAMRGLDVDSPLFRSRIQLKQCTILSGMGKHEEALNNCDAAVNLRIDNEDVSAVSRKEAHLTRAEALMLDNDFDEAVSDFRAAFDLVPEDDETGEKRELHQKLQSAMHQQEMWNGGKMDFRFNEKTGYPDGMPPQRDHAKILELPIDLEERSKEIKCAWLKKQFKTLVKKYHPDKYKGNKKRAARKFKEVKEAKEIISKEWEC